MNLRYLAGLSLFVVACSDGDSGSPSTSPGTENSPPVVVEIADIQVSVGDTVVVTIAGSDPDEDELEWDLKIDLTLEEVRDGYRPNLTWNPSQITFVPGRLDRPARHIEVWATDTAGAQDSTRFTVFVK